MAEGASWGLPRSGAAHRRPCRLRRPDRPPWPCVHGYRPRHDPARHVEGTGCEHAWLPRYDEHDRRRCLLLYLDHAEVLRVLQALGDRPQGGCRLFQRAILGRLRRPIRAQGRHRGPLRKGRDPCARQGSRRARAALRQHLAAQDVQGSESRALPAVSQAAACKPGSPSPIGVQARRAAAAPRYW